MNQETQKTKAEIKEEEAMVSLTNGIITIQVSKHGAELTHIILNETAHEYLWQADPTYWKRHSPVLFPIVGSVWNGVFRSKGQTYQMGQHGFARDTDFTLIDKGIDKNGNPQVIYALQSNEETLKMYPYNFRLEIGYRLLGRAIEVKWRVTNPDSKEVLNFQIGAHPAFYWPSYVPEQPERGYFQLADTKKTLLKSVITEKGCVDPSEKREVELDAKGFLALTTETFAHDALVFEDNQVQTVTLCDEGRRPYLTLKSEAPLMGLWSPPGKNAPFVCIEPWYGRCDRVHYDGCYEDKDWMQKLAPLEIFEASYQIVIE